MQYTILLFIKRILWCLDSWKEEFFQHVCLGDSLKVESTILESPDWSELHSENKHFKSFLLVVLWTDLTSHEFRLFTSRHHDVVISASFWSVYYN